MRIRIQSGFTIVEMLVAVAITGILLAVGLVNIPNFKSQMKVSEEIRRLGLTINSLRNEAIRQRTNVVLSFSSGGYSWDVNNNGTTEGTYTLESGVRWASGIPTAITINGLGLTRGIAGTANYSLRSGDTTLTLTLNSNGFISF